MSRQRQNIDHSTGCEPLCMPHVKAFDVTLLRIADVDDAPGHTNVFLKLRCERLCLTGDILAILILLMNSTVKTEHVVRMLRKAQAHQIAFYHSTYW